MALSRLCCYKPLHDNADKLSPENEDYVKVDHLSFFRINVFSDVMVKVQFEWSYDGKTKCSITSVRSGSRLWRSEKVDVLMPYTRIRIINESGALNEELVVHAFSKSDGRRPSVKFEEPPTKTQTPMGLEDLTLDEESHKIFTGPVVSREINFTQSEERNTTPKKRPWFSRKDKAPSVDKIAHRDTRMPDFIPEGSILMGGKQGKIILLPRGVPGEYLMVDEDGLPHWTLPPPKLLQDNGADKWVI